MVKILHYGNYDLGVVGKEIPRDLHNGITTLHVGDVVSFRWNGDVYTKPIIQDGDKYGIWGLGCNNLKFDYLTKVLPYTLLTKELFSYLNSKYVSSEFIIKDVDEKEMTVEEIEKELGYKIKIIK